MAYARIKTWYSATQHSDIISVVKLSSTLTVNTAKINHFCHLQGMLPPWQNDNHPPPSQFSLFLSPHPHTVCTKHQNRSAHSQYLPVVCTCRPPADINSSPQAKLASESATRNLHTLAIRSLQSQASACLVLDISVLHKAIIIDSLRWSHCIDNTGWELSPSQTNVFKAIFIKVQVLVLPVWRLSFSKHYC